MKIVPKFIRHAIDKSIYWSKIYRSGLFDAQWYLNNYPDAKKRRKSPLTHYVKLGFKKNYNPSPAFSTERYLSAYPDANANTCPLLHYIKKGKKQGRVCYSTQDMGVLKQNPTSLTPLVSVVVTSYNYASFIPETLDSILAQTYKNYEIIIIDDGSKDNSVEVIKEYVSRYSNIHLYLHDGGANCGLIKSMQLAISKCNGEYVAFCESDDYWAPEYLETKISLVNKYDDVVIISNDVIPFGEEKGVKIRQKYIDDIKKVVYPGGTPIDVRYNKCMNYIPTLSAVMIKRDVLQALNFQSPIPAWIDFWLYRQILKDHILYFTDKKLTYWRQHDSFNAPSNAEKFAKKAYEFTFTSDILIGLGGNHTAHNDHIELIRNSSLFDEEYYAKQVEDMYDLSPAAHYYYFGWRCGYDPSEAFSTNSYLAMYIDILASETCPLLHYLTSGEKEKRIKTSVKEAKEFNISSNDINQLQKEGEGKTKVLLISHELSLTGAPRALANMAYALKELGMYPVIISNKSGVLQKEIKEHGIPCLIDLTLSTLYINSDIHNKPLYKYVNNFDYVVFNTICALPFIELFYDVKGKKIAWIHDGKFGYECTPTTYKMTEMLSYFDATYVVGEYCRKITLEYCNKEFDIKNLLYFITNESSAAIPTQNQSDKLKMVLAGTIEERKGQETLLDSLELLPEDIISNIEITLAGVPFNPNITKKINNCKFACINYLGSINHDKLIKLMSEMDILLCPSLDDPMPIVCTEAFMLSKPVIVGSETGTAALIEEGKNGYVVKSGDAASLAQAITKAFNEKDNLQTMGKNAYQIYQEQFTYDSFKKIIKEIFS